jgi:hypothetical protein
MENLNEELDSDPKIEVSPDTPLFGVDAVIDSLSLVSIISTSKPAGRRRWVNSLCRSPSVFGQRKRQPRATLVAD